MTTQPRDDCAGGATGVGTGVEVELVEAVATGDAGAGVEPDADVGVSAGDGVGAVMRRRVEGPIACRTVAAPLDGDDFYRPSAGLPDEPAQSIARVEPAVSAHCTESAQLVPGWRQDTQ